MEIFILGEMKVIKSGAAALQMAFVEACPPPPLQLLALTFRFSFTFRCIPCDCCSSRVKTDSHLTEAKTGEDVLCYTVHDSRASQNGKSVDRGLATDRGEWQDLRTI